MRILHLEDDPVDGELVRIALRRADLSFEIKAVATRAAFLNALLTEDFDLILSDSGVPGFLGDNAREIVQQEGVGVPFIFVSGFMPETDDRTILRVSKLELDRLPTVIEDALKDAGQGRDPKLADG